MFLNENIEIKSIALDKTLIKETGNSGKNVTSLSLRVFEEKVHKLTWSKTDRSVPL